MNKVVCETTVENLQFAHIVQSGVMSKFVYTIRSLESFDSFRDELYFSLQRFLNTITTVP